MHPGLRALTHGAAMVLLLAGGVAAQQATTISGRVTTEGATPLQGVSVTIPSLNIGTFTNETGRYSFTVPATQNGRTITLAARRIGYQQTSRSVALNGAALTEDFTLAAAATQLEGLVVTALGMSRERSQLGTAQQMISSQELNTSKAMSFVQQVQGKIAGVSITGSGTQGGSTNINIRGSSSLAGNNQPLFIVDGIPVSNNNAAIRTGGAPSTQAGGGLINGYDFGNAISDLNPSDIESFTVLKGPNAAAIYGSRAANGVIVITTKKGLASTGRIRAEASTFFTIDQPSLLPDFQNQYGQGAGGSFEYVDGAGKGDCDGCDQSWGPKLDGRLIDQFSGKQQPWVAHPDNVKDFFRTGNTISTTLAASGGTDRANARLSLGMDNTKGFIPNNFFQKTSGLISGTLLVGDRLNTSATLQYIRNNGQNRAGTGYVGSTIEQFFWFGRQIDISELRKYAQGGRTNNGPDDREYNWNYNYHNNPFWIQDANAIVDTRDRFLVSATASYKLADWVSAMLRSGTDLYRFNVDQRFAAGNLNGAFVNPSYQGGYVAISDYSNENNTDALLNINRQLLSRLAVTATAGAGMRRDYFRTGQQGTTGLLVPGTYNPSNVAIPLTVTQTIQRRAVNGVYGSAAFTWNNWWTVEGTARNDWSSTLPKGANSYFYPSVNSSLVLTDALPMLKVGPLSFMKVRGAIAEVGADAGVYLLQTVFNGNANKFRGLPLFSENNTLANADLKPELTRSSEAGLELGFLDGRVSLDATYYAKQTRNQIFNVTISSTAGYAAKSINAGRMSNHGVEALLTVVPVQLRNGFQWTSTINYAHNSNHVDELTAGVENIVLGNGIFADSRMEAHVGQPYGAIYGTAFERDEATGKIITEDGLPVHHSGFVYLGNIQPKWIGGLNNTFTYKGLDFNVLLDARKGGKIVSYTNATGEYSGVFKGSLRGREVDWDNPGLIVDGIDATTGQPNTVRVTSEQYFQSIFPTMEPYVYDGSYVKLREMRLGYQLPARWASRVSASQVNVALVGRNLAMWKNIPNVDPEFAYNSGNFQGTEYAIPANARSIGFSVRVTP